MKKILYLSIFFLIFSFVFASDTTKLTPEVENILKAILNLLQKNATTSVVTPQPATPSNFLQGEGISDLPNVIKTSDLVSPPVLPTNVKPAIPSAQPVTPEIIKTILPDEDRENDIIVQINNLRITRIVTSTSNAKAVIFAVRDLGWRCLLYESEESSVSAPCALNLRKPILQKELVIKVVDDTILLFRDRKRAKIEDFQVGDKINVYGFMDKDNYGIEGLIVRNLSKSSSTVTSPVSKKFTGYIISKENCPPCVYQQPACLMPCKVGYYFREEVFSSLRPIKEYLLVPQNDQAREAIQKYADTNNLVTVEGTLKENTILVEKVWPVITSQPPVCIQVITPAQNPLTGECREFPTPCDVPPGWHKVDKCSVNIVPPVQKVEEIKVEADDYGFYPSELTFSKGSKVILTLVVKRSNVYYGGLDFRSEKFKTEPVKPGNTTKVEFVADKSFVISSYWPLSGVKKADLQVIVK